MDDQAKLAVVAFLEHEGLIDHHFSAVLFGHPNVTHRDCNITMDLDALIPVAEVVETRLHPWSQSEALVLGEVRSPPTK